MATRYTKIVNTRLTPKQRNWLRLKAYQQDSNVSDVIRDTLISSGMPKPLEVQKNGSN